MNGHSLWQGPRSRLQHHTITMPSASRRRVTHCGRESLSSATPPNHKAISRATMLHPVQNPLGLPPGLTSSPPLLSSPLLSSPLLSSVTPAADVDPVQCAITVKQNIFQKAVQSSKHGVSQLHTYSLLVPSDYVCFSVFGQRLSKSCNFAAFERERKRQSREEEKVRKRDT